MERREGGQLRGGWTWEFTLATVLALGMALEKTLSFAQVAAPAIKDRVIPRDRAITLADLLRRRRRVRLTQR